MDKKKEGSDWHNEEAPKAEKALIKDEGCWAKKDYDQANKGTSSAATTRRSKRKTPAGKRTRRSAQAKRSTSKSRTAKGRERSTKRRSR
jgi:hypothetical protein